MGKFIPTRFGPAKVRKDNFTHIRTDVLQKNDGYVEITRGTFADLLCYTNTSPSLWMDRNRPLDDEELQICQSKLGELCWLETASRPDMCARLARFSASPACLKVIDMYRINDLIKLVMEGQGNCTLKYYVGLPKPARRSLTCPDADWG